MTTIPGDKLHTTWFLCADDRAEHAVTDEEFARVRAEGGLCAAVCGHPVLMASCMSPPGPHCARCETYLITRRTVPNVADQLQPGGHSHRKASLLKRLFRLPDRSPADHADQPRANRPGPGHGGPAETSTSSGSAVHHRQE